MSLESSRVNQLERGVRIGDFEIEKRLGAGGMGIVYQARQVSLDRHVALKILGPALTQSSDLARFRREAQAVARLKHPGIATLYFIGQDEALCYHVMELVEGIPLRRVVDRLAEIQEVSSGPDTIVAVEMQDQPPAPAVRFDQVTTDDVPGTLIQEPYQLSPAAREMRRSQAYVRRCCEIVRDAARALDYAHGEGVFHRDIKPENLMLDQKGQVHIIDFGLARFFDNVSITNTGQLVGTPLYMSPEQVTGRIKVDHRTDIYSLGLVLYELLTLHRPIDFTSRENLLRNIVMKALPPLCARNPSLPRPLEAVVHKATRKDPEERYQAAAELAEELDRFLQGKPVTAPPYRYRLDVQELKGSRPGEIVLATFLCFLAGFTVFGLLTAMGVMMSFIASQFLMLLIQASIGLVCLGGTALLSHGMLAGWNWSRWVVVVLAGFILAAFLVGGIAMSVSFLSSIDNMEASMSDANAPEKSKRKKSPAKTETPPPDVKAAETSKDEAPFQTRNFLLGMYGMYAVPVVLAIICAATTLVALLRPSTGAWFRLAGRLRREHREMLLALSQ